MQLTNLSCAFSSAAEGGPPLLPLGAAVVVVPEPTFATPGEAELPQAAAQMPTARSAAHSRTHHHAGSICSATFDGLSGLRLGLFTFWPFMPRLSPIRAPRS